MISTSSRCLVVAQSPSETRSTSPTSLACPLLILNLWKQTGAIRESCARRKTTASTPPMSTSRPDPKAIIKCVYLWVEGWEKVRQERARRRLHPLIAGIRRRVEGGGKRYWLKTNKSAESGIKKGFVGGGKERKKQKRYIARRNNLASLRKRSECVWSRSIRATTGNNNNGNNKESAGP